jgi:hypothetical protein
MSPRECKASGALITAARPRLVATSSGRRRTRSASVPIAAPANVGTHMQRPTSAARPLEPVSVFTQIPAARDIAESPNPETITPPR